MMIKINEKLFVSNRNYTRKLLDSVGIRCVINLSHEQTPFQNMQIPLFDGPGNRWWDIVSAVDEVEKHITQGENVLVNCDAGNSRSPLIIVLYLVRTGMSLDDALTFIKKLHPTSNIHPELISMARQELTKELKETKVDLI